MAYSQEVKERAYTLDPDAWVSYTGKPHDYKASMDRRRQKALGRAQAEADFAKKTDDEIYADLMQGLRDTKTFECLKARMIEVLDFLKQRVP